MSVSNGHLPNSYEEGEDKPMLVVKKAGDGPGITALLNRQLQGKMTLIIYTIRSLSNYLRTMASLRPSTCLLSLYSSFMVISTLFSFKSSLYLVPSLKQHL